MDATTAMGQTDQIVSGLISNLTSDHREQPTPCSEWNVHDLLEHMCGGAHMIAGALNDQPPPENAPDPLANGPADGWSNAMAALKGAATPDALSSTHTLPFGEMPGEVALSVIVADHLTHAWDLAKATGQDMAVDDDLAAWALQTWQVVVPADGRPEGGGFAPVVDPGPSASALDQLVGYTGRNPAR